MVSIEVETSPPVGRSDDRRGDSEQTIGRVWIVPRLHHQGANGFDLSGRGSVIGRRIDMKKQARWTVKLTPELDALVRKCLGPNPTRAARRQFFNRVVRRYMAAVA